MYLTQDQLQAIADALADTSEGLTGSEIAFLLQSCRIKDTDASMTKRHRLYNAFAHEQNQRKDRTPILAFIRKAMKPTRFAREPHRFEPMRANLNRALAFAGMSVDASGKLLSAVQVGTLGEAERRARELREDLLSRGVHPDVLIFCKEELLHDNYFHAVLEAVKSVADKVRKRTGLVDDGAALVDRVFGGNPPMLAINSLRTKSEQDEQKGFTNLLKGAFGMFRNPTAHEARVNWMMSKDDAEDLLSLVSLIHRRIDAATMPPRI
ncbi:TIGR02391 family protein [Mesorhizobium sp. M1A.F.Ca.IN.022.05.2.1]|nr:TIGR02391 family protein [Mesorhizobium sp. M1A.F.Ca.IN.022.05.2.1]RWF83189.1 MAG: TIGR02391 family protein [Mesorhizobium sp.]RUW02781.1 TIGR02391 family protein [Mesorhizobium sp. M1A.F.Ca.IN.022.05.2.1]RWG06748.1 MAG: TIGR02391 family protein [Mesorhizobium sp.]RWG84055.1 MAG: TIGR02391 family protein [Mesorhizobium sp.]RWH07490.1 MAG: TIGR02391 family protein [Mesorhizobium sp.]